MMSRRPKTWVLWAMALGIGMLITLVEASPFATGSGGLLLNLVFWATLLQGAVAAVAVGELTNARWPASVKRELLAAHPLLFFHALLFLLLIPRLDSLPWAGEPNPWLDPSFFMIRNMVALFLAAGLAHLLARESLADGPRKKLFAVLYLFAFVLSQTLVAFDWVMALSYPWYSTILGAFYFVEATYAGFALGGICFFLLLRKTHRGEDSLVETHSRDLATLMFGFSILWAGLFFAQFLLLWYGNLPEEVGFVVERISHFPLREIAVIHLIFLFLVPFLTFLSTRAKEKRPVVLGVSVLILAGLLLERFLYIHPAAPVHAVIFLFEFIFMLILFATILASRAFDTDAPQRKTGRS